MAAGYQEDYDGSFFFLEWRGSQQCPVNKAIIIINVIGTPMIQSNIERIMVSFMSCNKIIRLLPY